MSHADLEQRELERAALAAGTVELRQSTSPSEAVRGRHSQRSSFSLYVALAWLALLVFGSIVAPLLPLEDYDAFTSLDRNTAPGLHLDEPLGTDATGRSVLSRIVYGARQSLLVGTVSVGIATLVGSLVGMVAGFRKGVTDRVIIVVLDTLLAFPPLVLLLAIAAVGGRDLVTLTGALAVVLVAPIARFVRSQTLVWVDREFVLAGRLMGASSLRLMTREIFPNIVSTLSSVVFLYVALVIVAEGTLSFLGLGIPPPSPSWGGMVSDGRTWLQAAPHLVLVPSTVLLLTVLSFRRVGGHFTSEATP